MWRAGRPSRASCAPHHSSPRHQLAPATTTGARLYGRDARSHQSTPPPRLHQHTTHQPLAHTATGAACDRHWRTPPPARPAPPTGGRPHRRDARPPPAHTLTSAPGAQHRRTSSPARSAPALWRTTLLAFPAPQHSRPRHAPRPVPSCSCHARAGRYSAGSPARSTRFGPLTIRCPLARRTAPAQSHLDCCDARAPLQGQDTPHPDTYRDGCRPDPWRTPRGWLATGAQNFHCNAPLKGIPEAGARRDQARHACRQEGCRLRPVRLSAANGKPHSQSRRGHR